MRFRVGPEAFWFYNCRCALFGAVLGGVMIAPSRVIARPTYFAEFKSMYLHPDGSDDDKIYAAKVGAVKCEVCHARNRDGKVDKKWRNSYGRALGALLTRDDQDNREKIRESLEKVSREKVPGRSETFGERIKHHKLPAPETEGD